MSQARTRFIELLQSDPDHPDRLMNHLLAALPAARIR